MYHNKIELKKILADVNWDIEGGHGGWVGLGVGKGDKSYRLFAYHYKCTYIQVKPVSKGDRPLADHAFRDTNRR